MTEDAQHLGDDSVDDSQNSGSVTCSKNQNKTHIDIVFALPTFMSEAVNTGCAGCLSVLTGSTRSFATETEALASGAHNGVTRDATCANVGASASSAPGGAASAT